MQRVWTVLVSVVCAWGAVSVRPDAVMAEERLSLWNGRAPIGDGSFEEADAWLTVHRPQQGNGTAIVICPGGGYGGLVTGAEGHGIAEWLNGHGITGAVLEYRLPAGRYRVPLLDAQRAIRTVRAHAAEWGLRSDRIGIMGFSAGGHLASTAATHFDDGDAQAKEPTDRIGCRPDFAVLIYPVVTMGKLTHGGSRTALLGKEPSAELIKEFSNEEQVTDRTPPTFLAHARDDEAVPPVHSQSFYEALKAHHVPGMDSMVTRDRTGMRGRSGRSSGWRNRIWWKLDLCRCLTGNP